MTSAAVNSFQAQQTIAAVNSFQAQQMATANSFQAQQTMAAVNSLQAQQKIAAAAALILSNKELSVGLVRNDKDNFQCDEIFL